MRTSTILDRTERHIDLTDPDEDREELLIAGIKNVIQSRLYARGYYSVRRGYFVNIASCDNIGYLNEIIDTKDTEIEVKQKAKSRIEQIRKTKLDGQMRFDDGMNIVETMTEEQFAYELEADAV